MRWSELVDKECIDLVNGEKMGKLDQADLSFHDKTGKIETIWIPQSQGWLKKNNHQTELSWKMIKKIGPETIIIDSSKRK
ncbi:YlmC/YmxH family sporulation protein [Hazenella sp. IB182357]|uniref:YlmC/YmxH family sporulation protein n=1 Tax=Polycladospora coralii TaxID=2771432 RepID=A0A926RUW4_9BACL|nr:YlmC/YmxH family sporulation protein [Polycladospora coralii]MBD1373483.1 YlmC/YmxH family sporulation protein [Polycladospora coralii]MBS7530787.1 YlmC/YmxH family sporulation protein [Polycladospora coralii]